ncbi:hypothetical protein CMQ_1452 [Grosmannia clavigera kw1407]|uniref:Uncharacterized protein n=1 Tax=Grosmannia clavigera (strain kw1407 / UAMH 11150) TaxID=655863 RepID=F0XF49_GROCL|nr:uncharacterized protein CMQ_1452 [Grosmannia clavigera kw1407]EFX04524.1 hypothetical protein CMQ_1452 [Grosmannia clavigera kw1407]
MPSLPDFTHRNTGDRSRSSNRALSPARKRPARSKEHERGELPFASGPLPFPMLIRTHKHTTPPARDDDAAVSPKEGRESRCGSKMHIDKHNPATDDYDMDSKPGDDSYDDDSTDSDSEDDEDVSCSLQRPLAPMRWPSSDAKPTMPLDGHGDRRQVSGRGRDDSSPARPRLFPLRWPLKRLRKKRKREASPCKPAPLLPLQPPGNGRSWEQEARGGSEGPGKDDSDSMAVRLTLRRRVPRGPPGLGMMRAGDMIRSLVTEARRNNEMYVLYKFDRVDELGGRRRGDRR